MILNDFGTLVQTNNLRLVMCLNTTGTHNEHHPLTPFNPYLIFEVGYIITTRGLHNRTHK